MINDKSIATKMTLGHCDSTYKEFLIAAFSTFYPIYIKLFSFDFLL